MKIIGRYPTDSTAAKRLDQVGPLPPGAAGMQVRNLGMPKGPIEPATGWATPRPGKPGHNVV